MPLGALSKQNGHAPKHSGELSGAGFNKAFSDDWAESKLISYLNVFHGEPFITVNVDLDAIVTPRTPCDCLILKSGKAARAVANKSCPRRSLA